MYPKPITPCLTFEALSTNYELDWGEAPRIDHFMTQCQTDYFGLTFRVIALMGFGSILSGFTISYTIYAPNY